MVSSATSPRLAELPAQPASPAAETKPSKILVIDVGGTNLKVLASGQVEPRKAPSGKRLTPAKLVRAVQNLTEDWEFDAVALGFPGLVGPHGPRAEPGNLGHGWVGFDFASGFGCPVRVINDAAMQALGSYEGGRMLFLGLGTGLGSAFIAEQTVIPLELGELSYDEKTTLGSVLGRKGLLKLGKKKWVDIARRTIERLSVAFVADYVVLGGGNAKKVRQMIPGCRQGHNLTAFRGGLRLWNIEDAPTLSADTLHVPTPSSTTVNWRVM